MSFQENKSWFIHFYREFGEWLQIKIKPEYLTACDDCNRMGISNPERLSKEYCHKMKISFRCASCLFPQYADSLKSPTRGNVEKIYGMRWVAHKNKFKKIIIF